MPKFRVGQIVVMTSLKREMPFRIIAIEGEEGEWFYAFNKSNFIAETSLRNVRNYEI